MRSSQILQLLELRHSQDIFVPECKTGPSMCVSSCPRLDAWVMLRSWTNFKLMGYEIKVDRGDFVNDQKYREYLPFCHQLYFCCPAKLIDPKEIDPDIGLMWVSSTGSRIYIKKKAPVREIEHPVSLYLYLLMARVKTWTSNEYDRDTSEWWKKQLELDDADYGIGRANSVRIRRILTEKVTNVAAENDRLKRENKKLQDIKDFLKALNITASLNWINHVEIERRYREVTAAVPPKLLRTLEDSRRMIDEAVKELRKINDIFQNKEEGSRKSH